MTLFFALSGFLLYRPIASRVLNGRPLQSLRSYLHSRSLRIVPAYWAILFATGVVLPATLFTFGMCLAVLMVMVEDGTIRLPRWWRVPTYALFAALVGATMLLADRGGLYRGAVPYELLTGPAAALLLALVVLPAVDASRSFLTRILDTRIFVAMGLVSYSLFLWHEPLQRLANHGGGPLAAHRASG